MPTAFANSTVQDDYRWGNLHRIVFDHPLNGFLNIPPTGGPGNVGPNLQGIARSGGFGAVDASAHDSRADKLNHADFDFTFGSGPARRKVAIMTPDGPDAYEVIPGGQSGMPGSPYQTDQLALWLVNDFHGLYLTTPDVMQNASACQTLVPPAAVSGRDGTADAATFGQRRSPAAPIGPS